MSEQTIFPALHDDSKEITIYLTNPANVKISSSLPLIAIANYTISVELHLPKSTISLGNDKDGIKILHGFLRDGNRIRQPLGNRPFPFSASIQADGSRAFTDDEKGGVLLRFTYSPTEEGVDTWPSAASVPVKTTLFDTPQFAAINKKLTPFKFIKVEDLEWGAKFAGRDFFNLAGFHFRFQEDKDTHLAHMQFWTAGTDVNCGVHNHNDAIFQEIHVALSQGTGNGGMSLLKKEYNNEEALWDPDSLPTEAFEHLVLKKLHEHGCMWHRDSQTGKAIRGKDNVVSYPWHKWQAGSGKDVDVWVALEFNPDLE